DKSRRSEERGRGKSRPRQAARPRAGTDGAAARLPASKASGTHGVLRRIDRSRGRRPGTSPRRGAARKREEAPLRAEPLRANAGHWKKVGLVGAVDQGYQGRKTF